MIRVELFWWRCLTNFARLALPGVTFSEKCNEPKLVHLELGKSNSYFYIVVWPSCLACRWAFPAHARIHNWIPWILVSSTRSLTAYQQPTTKNGFHPSYSIRISYTTKLKLVSRYTSTCNRALHCGESFMVFRAAFKVSLSKPLSKTKYFFFPNSLQ